MYPSLLNYLYIISEDFSMSSWPTPANLWSWKGGCICFFWTNGHSDSRITFSVSMFLPQKRGMYFFIWDL